MPSDVRKGFAFPATIPFGRPEAFRTSEGIAEFGVAGSTRLVISCSLLLLFLRTGRPAPVEPETDRLLRPR